MIKRKKGDDIEKQIRHVVNCGKFMKIRLNRYHSKGKEIKQLKR